MTTTTATARSPLQPDATERDALLARAAELAADHLDGVAAGPVAPPAQPGPIRAHLAGYDFAGARDATTVLEDVAAMLDRWSLHVTHPRYFGLFNPSPSWYAVVADLIVAAYNPQLAAWSHAPAAVEVEQHLLRFIGSRLGLPSDRTAGSFTTGGAEANHTGVLLALTRAFPAFAAGGIRALPGPPVMYASAESHLAWLKIAHACGIGRDAVRLVEADDDLCIDVEALRARIASDRRAGDLPFLVVGTAGTTSAGVIDPLGPLADVASDEGLSLHVDAAWGGAAALSDALRPALAGIERADSVTVDAHKWLSVPMGAGMFLCRHPEALARTFAISAAYMPADTDDAVDPYATSLQWSRRFAGLKLFMGLAIVGQEGYAHQLEHDAALGRHLARRLREERWEVVNDTPLPVVCFVDGDARGRERAIADAVVATGKAWISTTRLRGREVLRACVTHHDATPDDVEALIRALGAARDQA